MTTTNVKNVLKDQFHFLNVCMSVFPVYLKRGYRTVRIKKGIVHQKCGITNHRRPSFGPTWPLACKPVQTRSNRDEVGKTLGQCDRRWISPAQRYRFPSISSILGECTNMASGQNIIPFASQYIQPFSYSSSIQSSFPAKGQNEEPRKLD